MFPTGTDLSRLLLHEWGHSFVNPALQEHAEVFTGTLAPLYEAVADTVARHRYGDTMVFFYEQVVRAATTLAAGDLFTPREVDAELTFHARQGFYLTRLTMNALEEYRHDRARWPTFRTFVPVLIERYTQYLADNPNPGPSGRTKMGLLVIALLAGLLLMVWTRRRRRTAGPGSGRATGTPPGASPGGTPHPKTG
jgi:hypothetical protein